MERGRFYDVMDGDADAPVQSRDRRRGHHGLAELRADERPRANRLRRAFAPYGRPSVPAVFGNYVRRSRHDAAAHSARRIRRARSDVSRTRVLRLPAGARQDGADGDLSGFAALSARMGTAARRVRRGLRMAEDLRPGGPLEVG